MARGHYFEGSLVGLTVAVVAILGWGAFAWGAYYPWGYMPLLAACAVTGAAGLLTGWRGLATLPRATLLGIGAVVMAILVQLVPLPPATLARLSPSTQAYLQHERGRQARTGSGVAGVSDLAPSMTSVANWHPISVRPRATIRGLAFVTVFTVFFAGVAAMLARGGLRWLVGGITGLGVLLAIVAVLDEYELWPLPYGEDMYGPFYSKNHFAGWMLLALPLTISYVAVLSGVAGERRPSRQETRRLQRLVSSVLPWGLACVVMSVTLVMTMSRSGIVCLAFVLVTMGALARRTAAGTRRLIAVGFLIAIFAISLAWVGSEGVARRFAEVKASGLGERRQIWQDAWNLVQRFPIFGSGFNTYGPATDLVRPPPPTDPVARARMPLIPWQEAHNDYLQLAAEGGVWLAVPLIGLVFVFVRDVRARFLKATDDDLTRWIRRGAVVGLIAIALQDVVEFSLQMPGIAALFAVLCAIAVHQPAHFTAGDSQ